MLSRTEPNRRGLLITSESFGSDVCSLSPSSQLTKFATLQKTLEKESIVISNRSRRIFHFSAALACLGALSPTATAENYALIMTIDYAGTNSALPGIDKDADLAKRIATAMGVPSRNIADIRNRELTHDGIRNQVRQLVQRLAPEDKVMLYFSGHGGQVDGTSSGNRCSEGMFTADGKLYFDKALESDLDTLADKASQVVMFNDSCFSGGAASKGINDGSISKGLLAGVTRVAGKFYQGTVVDAASNAPGYSCGHAVNKLGRNLIAAGRDRGANVLYVAAAADNEVASATNIGSIATLAWEHCIQARNADSNASGSLDGEELRACAQDFIARNRFDQTITLVGDTHLPVFLNSYGQQTPGHVDAAAAMEDFRQTASGEYRVSLSPARDQLRIGQDKFSFSVSSNTNGYLYILLAGSDGKSFYQLFPNDNDKNNYIQAGTHEFPRSSWDISAQGPAGENHLMAVISPVERKFGDFKAGIFSRANVDPQLGKNLVSGPTGSGSFGASAVVSVREVN